MRQTTSRPLYLLTLTLVFLLQLRVTTAQFEGFFSNMFGGQQQHQQQQQQRSGASWSTYLDSVSCSQYLCPHTLDCVNKPSECPCPNIEDIRCLIPDMDGDVDDATVLCVRGQQECAEVERLTKKWSNKRSK